MLELFGRTPMVRLRRIAGASAGIAEIACKLEGQNPAGSVKDRGCLATVEAALGSSTLAEVLAEPTQSVPLCPYPGGVLPAPIGTCAPAAPPA